MKRWFLLMVQHLVFWRFDEDDSSSEEDDVPAEGDSDNDSDEWDYRAYDWEGL